MLTTVMSFSDAVELGMIRHGTLKVQLHSTEFKVTPLCTHVCLTL